MSGFFVLVSFELNNKGLLSDWKILSKEIDDDISSVKGFISRDSGIDEQGYVYCLLKWQSRTYQEAFMRQLESRDDWPKTMEDFGRIANIETMTFKNIALF
ncbi:hypothetical protein [bacterium endosymbiont of Bathymodiolus sp. 5 South]|uniref:hypothetical protein n=1 Tax=bacterium endosymbiont of Bathymodiolus sp. 5 South TaxID=1181670 RepID=UPI0010B05A29|nr:hypothetical protein [bacterium endosymbiont of Bathymodiolus sp. 5 South]SSC07750.1 hypothetical protein BTURTLESOX_1006 [bacterium endosymbiont of Bathymodiolus sp. 5 South]VVH61547.1 hypothetical protein BSPWISOX_2159 [uncultured Gammaproteobacteria bacterium]